MTDRPDGPLFDQHGVVPPAWERDATDLFYAARGAAESEVHHALRNHNITPDDLAIIRLSIAAAASSTLGVLRAAGWMRWEPELPLRETPLYEMAREARAVLEAWEDTQQ